MEGAIEAVRTAWNAEPWRVPQRWFEARRRLPLTTQRVHHVRIVVLFYIIKTKRRSIEWNNSFGI
jgi:hypothetical protein